MALVERGLVDSRTKAQDLVRSGAVSIDGKTEVRSSKQVHADSVLDVSSDVLWVSRGALKLLAALEAFNLDPKGKTAADVGASTGGFTEVLLRMGVERVVAVDVGRGQLHASLSNDPRVTSLESTDIRDVDADEVGGPFDLVVADLSFVSITKVADALVGLVADGGDLIALVKPQFEVGRGALPRTGVVTDAGDRKWAVQRAEEALEVSGLEVISRIESPVLGRSGNTEFLVWGRKSLVRLKEGTT